MANKPTKMLTIVMLTSTFVTVILFSHYSSEDVHEHVWSLNFSDFWIGSQAKIHSNSFQTSKHLIRTNGNLETSVDCIGPPRNQSCLFQNLYYINRTFWILTTKKTLPVLPNVRIGFTVIALTRPARRRFYTYADLEDFVRTHVNPLVLPRLTVHFEQLWLMNIGHALFDGLYPAYLALIRFPPRHLHPFRILLSAKGDNKNHSFTDDVYNRFAGLETINSSILEEMSVGRWFAFEQLVMGTGDLCQRCLQPHLQLPGGVELDGSRLFRDRMYKQHGVRLPVNRRNHSAEGRDRRKPLKVVVIDNKRFTSRDRIEISAAIDDLNAFTRTRQRSPSDNQTESHWPLIEASYISYTQVSYLSGVESAIENDDSQMKMVTHLRFLRDVDIHISGPGTGQMYQTFLPDGSVNVNLGGIAHVKRNSTFKTHPIFMEQYMTAGTPYIKGLYYPIKDRLHGIRREIVIELIRRAAQLIHGGFAIPVEPKENLAVYGHLFVEMCERDQNFCATVTERFQQLNFWCFNTWPESIIYEMEQWSTDGIKGDDGKWVTCPFNQTLLQQLKEKYKISAPLESPLLEQR